MTEGAAMFENISLTLTLAQAGDDPAPGNLNDAAPAAPATPPAPGTEGATTGDGQQTVEGQDPNAAKNNQNDKPPSIFGDPMFMFLILGLLIFWIFIFNGPRKEKKKRAQMLAAMSKNDRVVTIGGIIGTVVEMKDNEVVLKVDESSNTRMRFSRNAIQSVMGEESDKK
jgi:preprotein translocase subunit YajC